MHKWIVRPVVDCELVIREARRMAFEKRARSSREYYYVGTRVGKKVVKTYLGRRGDPAAELARLLIGTCGRHVAEPEPRPLTPAAGE